jgi:glycosyltransferase involved in cell wall biosynthesis
MLKIALAVNEPPPYRIPIFNLIAAAPDIDLQVIFFCRREPNRLWDLPPIAFDHVFLRERISTVNGRYIHNNPDVLLALSRFKPDVVLGNGFNPSHMYALGWTRFKHKAYVPMTDGTLDSERMLSSLHKRLRRFTYARASRFIAASNGGIALYKSYGIPNERCLLSCLCIDNARFKPESINIEKSFDFIFCSRIEAAKSPDFALEVAHKTALLLNRRTRILFVGSGTQEQATRTLAKEYAEHVDTHFHGFASQQELPALYQSAKIFLFPTQADVWGVVANEACASGLAVMVSPHAGAAGELIVDEQNGHVCELNAGLWATRAAALLKDERRLQAYGERSLLQVERYRFDLAAQGIMQACREASEHECNTQENFIS